jgi:type IV secretory pathway TraG/TraD family ATPase VirD4
VECDNFRYQIYFKQEDLETSQYLETRCGSKSGFAHSKTEHEGHISTGENEHKIPLITAQYIMYDMPDDEILGFWGKRPFIAKAIPFPPNHKDPEPLKLPALRPVTESLLEAPQAPAEPRASWHDDPSLFPQQSQYIVAKETGEKPA